MSKVTINVEYGETEINVVEVQVEDYDYSETATVFPEVAWNRAVARVLAAGKA